MPRRLSALLHPIRRLRGLPRGGEPRDDDPNDRGDVPGWVLVTLMTAGLVLTLWAVAGPRFTEVFTNSIDSVVGGP